MKAEMDFLDRCEKKLIKVNQFIKILAKFLEMDVHEKGS